MLAVTLTPLRLARAHIAHGTAASIPPLLVLLAAVRRILGPDAHRTWTELQRGKYRRFIRAYRVFLQFR